MRRKKLLASVLVLAMTVTMFAGCGTKKTDTTETTAADSSKETTAATTGLYPGTSDANSITVNITSEPPQLNTMITTDTTSFAIIHHVIENLTTLDDNDKVQPGVAKDWTVSEDGLTYTFNLRDDMKWTNGEPVTANDFVFAWTKLLTPETTAPYAYFGYVIKNGQAFNTGKAKAEDLGIKAKSDYQLEVTLERPIPYFLDMCAFAVLAPVNEKAYNEIGAEAYGTDADKMVYNGPFKMTSWEHEDNLVLEKNPDYYNAANISLEKIKMVMINDSNAALNAFKAGEVDIIGLNGDQVKMLKDEGYPTNSYNDGSCFYLEYNLTDKYLENANLRKALTYAVDKQAFVDSIVKNPSLPATSFTAPLIKGLNGSFKDEVGNLVPTLDVAKAKEYYDKALKELGTDKVELSMICDDTDTATLNAAFIQEQLKTNLGIDLKIESMPFKSRIERMDNKDFSIVFAGWGPDYNDPMTFLDMFETGNGNNHTSYSSEAYDALLKQIREEKDPAKRDSLLIQTEKLLMEDLPIGPIYWRCRDYAVSEKIASGVVRTGFQDMDYINVKLK